MERFGLDLIELSTTPLVVGTKGSLACQTEFTMRDGETLSATDARPQSLRNHAHLQTIWHDGS